MSIPYISQDQAFSAVQSNLANKGFAPGHPTPGCTYVVQPPRAYHDLFQNLQRTIQAEKLPIAPVRIPHSTVMLAKVIDRKPGQSWKDLERVQKIYQGFLFLKLSSKSIDSLESYRTAVNQTLIEIEETLARIATATNEEEAIRAIQDESLNEHVLQIANDPSEYLKIRQFALESLNQISFDLKLESVSLISNGAVIFKQNESTEILQMRLDLIVAGQGISKWPRLSATRHGWSTVGYSIRPITSEEKIKIDAVMARWVEENQETLRSLSIRYNSDTLGCLAVRSNDFYAVKKMDFPMATGFRKRPTPIQTREISIDDLRMSPRAGEEGPTPIAGNRQMPTYGREIWQGPIHQEVIGSQSYEKHSNWKPALLFLCSGLAVLGLKLFSQKRL